MRKLDPKRIWLSLPAQEMIGQLRSAVAFARMVANVRRKIREEWSVAEDGTLHVRIYGFARKDAHAETSIPPEHWRETQ